MKTGWEIKPMGEVGVFQRGGGFLKSDFVENGFPCIHYGQIHMKLGATTYSHLTCIPASVAAKSKIASTGDVIIAITSEDVAGSCKSTAWMGNYDVAIGAHAAIFKHNLNPLFVSYYIQSCYFQRAKEAYTHGFKVVEIKPSDIAKIPIRFPSLPEQQRIVDILDQEFAKIDALKANAEKSLQAAKDLFQATLKKKLEPKEGWKVSSMGEVSSIARGGSPRPIKAFITEDADGINWIKIGDTEVGGKYISSTKEKIRKEGMRSSRFVEAGDFLLSNSMSFGRPYILKTNGCIHDGWLVIKKYEDTFTQDFLYYLLLSPSVVKQFEEGARGSTVRNLNTDIVSAVRVSYPSTLKEQEEIVAQVEEQNYKCKALQDNYQKTLTLCDDLKQALLRKAFNGEL